VKKLGILVASKQGLVQRRKQDTYKHHSSTTAHLFSFSHQQ